MAKILIIDEGTSSTRAALYDENLNRGEFAQIEIPLLGNGADIVEQDANLIFNKTLEVARTAAGNEIIECIGITNQRETTILWDKNTGEPVYNAIIWQDRRGADFCEILRKNGAAKILTQKTGLLADPYFSAFKIRWMLQNIDCLMERAKAGEILFGNIDTWLIWKLTGDHYTDFSNASRTAIFDIYGGKWDWELLDLFEIPHQILPDVLPSHSNFGYCLEFDANITGVLGDQQAALMGQNCIKAGQAKITFGTGAFLMVQCGVTPQQSNNKMLTTIASNIPFNEYFSQTNYAIEGAALNAGTAIKWLRDELGIIESASETQAIAQSIPDNGGVYFVPAFTGLGAPYWNPDARGTIVGLGRHSTKAHIVRAALEASAYQTFDLLEAIKKDGVNLEVLRIDGGMANNDFFCQFLADICNMIVERPKDLEMTAMGAARIASGAQNQQIPYVIFTPLMNNSQREKNIQGWAKAIKSVLI
jgi:glycerol kinase